MHCCHTLLANTLLHDYMHMYYNVWYGQNLPLPTNVPLCSPHPFHTHVKDPLSQLFNVWHACNWQKGGGANLCTCTWCMYMYSIICVAHVLGGAILMPAQANLTCVHFSPSFLADVRFRTKILW